MATARYYIFVSLWLTSLMLSGQADVTMTLTDSLREVSGITSDGEYLWMINDSGNEPLLFEFHGEKWVGTYPVAADNTDWESITRDIAGNLHIGDIGDNRNRRSARRIYVIPRAQLNHQYDTLYPQLLEFSTPYSLDSLTEPSDFDWESLIWYGGKYYTFSKNRRPHFDGASIQFSAPIGVSDTIPVFFSPQDTTQLGGLIREMSWVTDACLSADRRHIFLLSSNKVYGFLDFPGDRFFEGYPITLSLGSFTQKEAITAWNDTTLLIADEVSPLGGGKVYYLDLTEALDEYVQLRRSEVQLASKLFDTTLHITVNAVVNSSVILEVYDDGGRALIGTTIGEVTRGQETTFNVDVSDWEPGMYIVNIRLGRFPHGFFVAKKGDWREALER